MRGNRGITRSGTFWMAKVSRLRFLTTLTGSSRQALFRAGFNPQRECACTFWTRGGKGYRVERIRAVQKRASDACGLKRSLTRRVSLTTTGSCECTHAWELGCVCFEKIDLARSMISWLREHCPQVGPGASAQWRLLRSVTPCVVDVPRRGQILLNKLSI